MQKKRVCILGGSGFVGRRLVPLLHSRGYVCRIITRHPQRHRHLAVNPGTQLVTARLFDTQSLTAQFTDCDAVINLIGILNESGRQQTFRRFHVELVDQVVDACRLAGVPRLLHMSALHANEASGSSLYLRSKGEGENRAHTRGGSHIDVTSFRPSVIFGPGDSFFNRFASLLKLSPGFFPLACPDARFAPVYVGDVAEAFVVSLDDRRTFDQHYDLCGPATYSLKALVDYTAKTLGIRRRILGLGDLPSRWQAMLLGHLPGKPFSLDNYLSLQTDSICNENGFLPLGITPQGIEAVVPAYLAGKGYRGSFDRYRKQPG